MLTALVLNLSSSTPLASPWEIKSNHDSCCTPNLDLLHYKYLQSIENKKSMYFRTLQVWKKKSYWIQIVWILWIFFIVPWMWLIASAIQCWHPEQIWRSCLHSPWFCHTRRGCPKACAAPLERISSDLFQTAVEKWGNKSFLIWNAPTHWIETMLLPMGVFSFHQFIILSLFIF